MKSDQQLVSMRERVARNRTLLTLAEGASGAATGYALAKAYKENPNAKFGGWELDQFYALISFGVVAMTDFAQGESSRYGVSLPPVVRSALVGSGTAALGIAAFRKASK
jgi:hypothetical protein